MPRSSVRINGSHAHDSGDNYLDARRPEQGIATFLYRMLAQHAMQNGLQGLTADVLASNKSMLKVFEKGDVQMQARLLDGVYALTMTFKHTTKNND